MRGFLLAVVVLAIVVALADAQCSSFTDPCSCIAQTGCGLCVNGQGASTGCVAGNSSDAFGGCGTGTNWNYGSSSSIGSACATSEAAGCAASASGGICSCLPKAGCGVCVVGNTANACLEGNDQGPLDSFSRTCSQGDWRTADDIPDLDTRCKVAKAKAYGAIAAGVAVPVVLICFVIIWWCCRGRYWWESTSHKRCCCDEDACCNGMPCGCHPWDAQPPPHGKGDGRKSQATRVAPCFPHNPCAWCANMDEEHADFEEAHPCGLGLGCGCYWVPGCLCFMWPGKCRQCCEDELDGKVGDGKGGVETADADGKKKSKRKGFTGFGSKKKKNKSTV